ncbi:hypothetical protein ACOME3_006984 [Neoechinorhynchus agilis]
MEFSQIKSRVLSAVEETLKNEVSIGTNGPYFLDKINTSIRRQLKELAEKEKKSIKLVIFATFNDVQKSMEVQIYSNGNLDATTDNAFVYKYSTKSIEAVIYTYVLIRRDK